MRVTGWQHPTRTIPYWLSTVVQNAANVKHRRLEEQRAPRRLEHEREGLDRISDRQMSPTRSTWNSSRMKRYVPDGQRDEDDERDLRGPIFRNSARATAAHRPTLNGLARFIGASFRRLRSEPCTSPRGGACEVSSRRSIFSGHEQRRERRDVVGGNRQRRRSPPWKPPRPAATPPSTAPPSSRRRPCAARPASGSCRLATRSASASSLPLRMKTTRWQICSIPPRRWLDIRILAPVRPGNSRRNAAVRRCRTGRGRSSVRRARAGTAR